MMYSSTGHIGVMIPQKTLKAVLASDDDENTVDRFIDLQRCMEGYFKRVLLIALRLQGAQYKASKKIAENNGLHLENLIDKALYLLHEPAVNNQVKVIRELEEKYSDFKILKDLFLKFTAVARNKYSHGAFAGFSNEQLFLLCHVNRSFFKEFENVLSTEFGNSVFNEPKDWGAKKGAYKEIEEVRDELNVGINPKTLLDESEVKEKLEDTPYAIP